MKHHQMQCRKVELIGNYGFAFTTTEHLVSRDEHGGQILYWVCTHGTGEKTQGYKQLPS